LERNNKAKEDKEQKKKIADKTSEVGCLGMKKDITATTGIIKIEGTKA